MEYDKQVAEQKKKLTEMSDNIRLELAFLVVIEKNPIQAGRSEKTLKERYLEAVSCLWKTVREVCLQVHPEMDEGSRVKESAMKSTSMFLMRLSKPNVNLVERRSGKTGFEYRLNAKGLRSLLYYSEKAVRTGRKKMRHEQMEKCVKLNDTLIPEIEQMHTYNTEIMKKLENIGAAKIVHQTYGNIVGDFTLQITELQRAIIDGDDDSHVNVLIQSTKSLLQLCKVETDMYDLWRTILEDQERLMGLIREAELELEKQLERNQRQEMARAEKKVWNPGLPAPLLRDIAAARKLDAGQLLEFWFSDKTEASSDFGKKVKEILVFVAFYTGSSNAQAILKEAQTKARDGDPQTVKKAEILLQSLPFPPKHGQTRP